MTVSVCSEHCAGERESRLLQGDNIKGDKICEVSSVNDAYDRGTQKFWFEILKEGEIFGTSESMSEDIVTCLTEGRHY
jgi:hypothetical protein